MREKKQAACVGHFAGQFCFFQCKLALMYKDILSSNISLDHYNYRSISKIMGKRILIVLTSKDTLGDSNHKTGWYLPELAHPLKVLFDAGFTSFVDSVSPKGGLSPVVRKVC